MKKEVSIERFIEILPTFNSHSILVLLDSGMYLDSISVTTPKGYVEYEISLRDQDPRHADDAALFVLGTLLEDGKSDLEPDTLSQYRSKWKPWKTLKEISIGEDYE